MFTGIGDDNIVFNVVFLLNKFDNHQLGVSFTFNYTYQICSVRKCPNSNRLLSPNGYPKAP